MNKNQVATEMIGCNKDLPDAASTGMAALQHKTRNQISNVMEKKLIVPSAPSQRSIDFKTRYNESYKKVFDYLVKTEKNTK
ncbi:MAG: hypothetical protein AB2L12_17610 [Smithellaceae bacterium]